MNNYEEEWVALAESSYRKIYHELTSGGPLDCLTFCGLWTSTKTRRKNTKDLQLCKKCEKALTRRKL